MDKNKELERIARLSNAYGISGFEDDVTAILRKEAEGLGAVSEDAMRNVYIERKENTGGKPVLMLDAHSDEVGFMVKAIRPDGMLEFTTIGGWVVYNIPAHLVHVLNSEGKYIPGVVASKPPHFMTPEERKAPLELSQLVIDVGSVSMEEVTESFKIEIGAPVVPDASFYYNEENGVMRGKAFDNRLGSAAVLSVLEGLQGLDLAVDVVGAIASQEEVGTRGAVVTAQRVKPDVCLVFEGCPADDTVLPAYQAQTVLKKGPMLRHIDARMITSPRFLRFALETAKKNGIKHQRAVRTGGSTNGAPIHVEGKAVPSVVIGMPVRYAHTSYCYSSYEDYENGVRLGTAVAEGLTKEVIESF